MAVQGGYAVFGGSDFCFAGKQERDAGQKRGAASPQ
jgi:hypothetical protein